MVGVVGDGEAGWEVVLECRVVAVDLGFGCCVEEVHLVRCLGDDLEVIVFVDVEYYVVDVVDVAAVVFELLELLVVVVDVGVVVVVEVECEGYVE